MEELFGSLFGFLAVMWFIVRALISRSAAARRRAADRELTSSSSSPAGDTRTDAQQEIPPHTPPSQAARPMSRTEPVSGAQYLRSSDYLPQDAASVTIDESTEETSFFDPADSIWAQKSADTGARADEYSGDDTAEQTPPPTRAPASEYYTPPAGDTAASPSAGSTAPNQDPHATAPVSPVRPSLTPELAKIMRERPGIAVMAAEIFASCRADQPWQG